MNSLFYWEMLGLTLSLAIFLASVGVFLFSVLNQWQRDASFIFPSLPASPPETVAKADKRTFLQKYRWEFLLGGVLFFVFLFAWIYAPPRLNGGISPSPGEPGRPFYNLRWGRNFIRLRGNALWSYGSSLFGILAIFFLARVIQKKTRSGAEFLLLLSAMNLAVLGQWLISQPLGIAFYAFASGGFLLWGWQKRKSFSAFLEPKPRKKTLEIGFVILLLLTTAFSRLYTLERIPYGIEGDEAKWTAEAINLTVRGVPDGAGEYHRDALPVSYYLQTPLQRLLTPGIFSARLTVALLSILASLLFYFFLREIVSFPIAAVSSFLLSVSIFDISASRLANVESFVKIFPILSLLLLLWALKSRRWQAYVIVGVALALGMLTYDTLWSLAPLLLLLAWIELTRQKATLAEKVKSLSALFAPTVLALPLLIPYFNSRLSYYKIGEKWTKVAWHSLFSSFASTWFVKARPDFLYNRDGALLNALLLPFLLLGIILAILRIRERVAYWFLLWAGIFLLPVPMLTHSFLGRVYYPALPALYFFVGLGLVFFAREIFEFFGKSVRPLFLLVALLFFAWLPLSNLYIYFNEVYDPPDRQRRREIGEFAAEMAGDDVQILLPTEPNANLPLNNEYQTVEMYLLRSVSSEKINETYRYVPPNALLQEIEKEKPSHSRIEILLDEEKTPQVLDALRVCYPQGKIFTGEFFTRISLPEEVLRQGGCLSAALSLDAVNAEQISWALENLKTQEITLYCSEEVGETHWLEAENLPVSPGWQAETRFATGWSGSGFMLDNFESKPFAIESVSRPLSGAYIWLRSYLRTEEKTDTYLRIDGVKYPIANPVEGELNHWRWERVGPVALRPDSEILLVHPKDTEPFMAIFLDVFVITADAEFYPDSELYRDAEPHRFLFERVRSKGLLTPELPSGNYLCQAVVETARPVMDTGENYILSEVIEFESR